MTNIYLTQKCARRLTSNVLCTSTSGVSKSFFPDTTPALFIRIFTSPTSVLTLAAALCIWDLSLVKKIYIYKTDICKSNTCRYIISQLKHYDSVLYIHISYYNKQYQLYSKSFMIRSIIMLKYTIQGTKLIQRFTAFIYTPGTWIAFLRSCKDFWY